MMKKRSNKTKQPMATNNLKEQSMKKEQPMANKRNSKSKMQHRNQKNYGKPKKNMSEGTANGKE